MIRSTSIALLLAGIAQPALIQQASAQAGVATLLEQGRYWQGKGRGDLARTAYRRVLALDPSNAEARRALSNAAPTPTPAPRPTRAAPSNSGALGGPAPTSTPRYSAPTQQSARPANPTPTPAPAPTRRAAPVDRGAVARAAGFDALESGNLAGAERQFNAALAIRRTDADATGGLGIVRLRQSRFAEASDLLARASSRGNAAQWSEALGAARFYAGMETAREKLARGDIAGARTDAEALSRASVRDKTPAFALLADIAEQQGRYAEAADFARQAGTAGGNGQQLQARLARDEALQAAARGDTVTAETQFQRGIQSDQTDPWIRYEYARFLLARGRTPEAESLIQSLQGINSPDATYAAAMLQAQQGRSTQAASTIARIPEANRTPAIRRFQTQLSLDAVVARARVVAANGRAAEAAATLRQIGQTEGLSAGSLASVAGALDEIGDTGSAVAFAQRALAAGPATVAEYEPIVRVLGRGGQDGAVASAIERARATGGSADGGIAIARLQSIATTSQADRLRLQGQFAPAFDLLQQAWAGAPGDPEVLGALARLYQSGNLSSQAAQTYQMVLARNPRDKGALTGLIGSAGAAGDNALANATVQRALQFYPEDPQVFAAAGQMEQARGNRRAALRYLRRGEAAYAARNGGGTLSSSNPFAGSVTPNNPFRANEAMAAAPMANPFMLSGGPIPAAPMAFAANGATYPVNPQPYSAPVATAYAAPAYAAPAYASPAPAPVAFGSPVATQGTPVPFTVAPAYGATPTYGATPAFGGTPGYSAAPVAVAQAGSGDPQLAQLRNDIVRESGEAGPRADLKVGYRERSGEVGTSDMRELSATASISTDVADGRVGISASPVVIDSGRPTGSALARFGRNASEEALAIAEARPARLVQADTQHASGVAVNASYESAAVRIEVGSTPIGFDDTKVTWGFTAKPRLSRTVSAQGWVRNEAVTDSVAAYAGTTDPVSGVRWGQVMRMGGGGSLSWDDNGTGIYGDVSAYRYTGLNIRDNRGYQVNVGGYLPVYRDSSSTLTAGLNLNWQSFDNNQNFFTYGHGGYFSPQSFLSMSLPLRYAYNSPRWEGRLSVAPGYQSFEQEQSAIYPTDPSAQAALDLLKLRNADVRSFYDSLSVTGFAVTGDGSLFYRISPNTRIGASASVNTVGTYDEYRSTFELRQSLGGDR